MIDRSIIGPLLAGILIRDVKIEPLRFDPCPKRGRAVLNRQRVKQFSGRPVIDINRPRIDLGKGACNCGVRPKKGHVVTRRMGKELNFARRLKSQNRLILGQSIHDRTIKEIAVPESGGIKL